ncbi:hypothetical protein ABTX80_06585 [Streptomyces erythrochromogenes]|uniref:hypothetical protein n=1 Tax=Streptomyces erythrochromogenes TaxID=285574 RepID=UPI00331CA97D
MGRNIAVGDQVTALVDLGRGVTKGTRGTVTSVSFFHGLATVRFSNGAEIPSVRLHQITHA